ELSGGAAAEEARLPGVRALVGDTDGFTEEGGASLLTERERLRHVTELADAAGRALAALAPEEGEGAAALIGGAERSLAEVAEIAPELDVAAGELRDTELRLAETTLERRRFLDALQAEPDRLEQVESELERI